MFTAVDKCEYKVSTDENNPNRIYLEEVPAAAISRSTSFNRVAHISSLWAKAAKYPRAFWRSTSTFSTPTLQMFPRLTAAWGSPPPAAYVHDVHNMRRCHTHVTAMHGAHITCVIVESVLMIAECLSARSTHPVS